MIVFFFFQAEDGIRDLVRSRGLGDVYKRQGQNVSGETTIRIANECKNIFATKEACGNFDQINYCLLYTSDAADERSSVDLGGRRIIKKKTTVDITGAIVT